MLLLTVASAV